MLDLAAVLVGPLAMGLLAEDTIRLAAPEVGVEVVEALVERPPQEALH